MNLEDDMEEFPVFCDMTTDHGGWAVLQRRQDGSQDFYLNFSDYKNGFGDLDGEFWLGLDKIHRLSKSGMTVARIDMEDFGDEKKYAKYLSFSVENEEEMYRLTTDKYSGNELKLSVHERSAP